MVSSLRGGEVQPARRVTVREIQPLVEKHLADVFELDLTATGSMVAELAPLS
jgi:hypothetical protein